MSDQLKCSRAVLKRHWDVLCNQIGERYAGSQNEQAAADYIEQRFRRLGLANVHQQAFKFPNWSFSKCAVRTGRTRPTRRIATARPQVYSSSTPAKGVTGPMVYLQAGDKWDLAQPLKGKVGLLVGSLLLGTPWVKNALARSGLKALITVDKRIPFGWTTSNGASPAWVDGYRVPTVSISYMDAINMVEKQPVRVHVNVQARSFPAMSQNVIGEIAGTRFPNEVIVVSAHHDCVYGNVGADDNASGVLAVLELARLFARRKPKRTIRFISFGVEERLSVGAYLYMRSLNKAQAGKIVFGLNLDTIATAVGHDVVYVTGSPQIERFVRQHWNRRKHPVEVSTHVSVYADQFPLNMIGAPTLMLTRPSIMTEGYWQLHSEHDNPNHVSGGVAARTIDTSAALVDCIAGATKLPFPRRIEPAVAQQVRELGKSEYRHPWSPKSFDYDR